MQKPVEQDRLKVLILTILPLILHVVCTLATLIFVFYVIDNKNFNIDQRRPLLERRRHEDWVQEQVTTRIRYEDVHVSNSRPLQSDITTALSTMIVVGRAVASVCTLISWKLLAPSLKGLGTSRAAYAYITALILILSFPAQLASPVLTGAVSWVPSHQHHHSPFQFQVPSSAPNTKMLWEDYIEIPALRFYVVTKAVRLGLTTFERVVQNNTWASDTMAFPRPLPQREGIEQIPTPDCRLKNVTLPYISVTNLQEELALSSLPSDMIRAVHEDSGRLNITSEANPINTSRLSVSQFALIPHKPWKPTARVKAVSNDPETIRMYEYPAPNRVSGRYYLAETSPFFYCDEYANKKDTYYENPSGNCFRFASVDIVAGVQRADCAFGENRTLYSLQPSLSVNDTQPDFLVEEVFHLMPEVMTTMVPLLDQFDIESNIVGSIMVAYGAAWSSLVGFLEVGAEERTPEIAVRMLKGRIDRSRVLIWVALNALVWIASILFWTLQARCKRPMTGETFVAAMFLDTSQIHDPAESGLGDAICVTSQHDRLGILRLVHEDGHSKVVKDDRNITGGRQKPRELEPLSNTE